MSSTCNYSSEVLALVMSLRDDVCSELLCQCLALYLSMTRDNFSVCNHCLRAINHNHIKQHVISVITQ